jgi:hypothetical protein
MAKGRLFGARPVGAVTLVEAPVSQWYARRARIAFMGVAGVTGVVAAGVLSVFTNPLAAILLGIIAGTLCGFVAAAWIWAWPVLRVLWWWSTEIAVLLLVVFVPSLLARVTHPLPALGVVLTVGGVCGGVRPVRRWLAAWSWCLVVRHRLRLCFAGFARAGSGTRPGSLPLVLWARPTPAGERVWLWLRPGLDLADLDGKTGRVAVACWAGEARVVRTSTRYAALVRVDLARRDPLTGLVASPLALLIPRKNNAHEYADVPVSPGMPPVGLDLADVPEPAPEPRGGGRR